MSADVSESKGAWLFAAGPEIPRAFEALVALREKLNSSTANGYAHTDVLQAQLTAFHDDVVKNKMIDPETGKLLDQKMPYPKQFFVAQAYAVGSALRLLDLYITTKQMILIHLIDATVFALETGNLIVVMMMLRSIIEHIALFSSLQDDLKKSFKKSDEENSKTIFDITGRIAKYVFGSRIDWKRAVLEAETIFSSSKGKLSYQKQSNREDLSAIQILNAVDHLDEKRIHGVRAAYEVMSEFVHPNVGTTWALTTRVGQVTDEQKVQWIQRDLGLKPPIGIVQELAPAICQSILRATECLQLCSELVDQALLQRERLFRITQMSVRPILENNGKLFSPYAACPCVSGAKIKFCCGKSKN